MAGLLGVLVPPSGEQSQEAFCVGLFKALGMARVETALSLADRVWPAPQAKTPILQPLLPRPENKHQGHSAVTPPMDCEPRQPDWGRVYAVGPPRGRPPWANGAIASESWVGVTGRGQRSENITGPGLRAT